MTTLINPPGIKTLSGLQMHSPNYTHKAPSYGDAISTRWLYWTMMWLFWNLYPLPFIVRPLRALRTLGKAVTTGAEDTRYAKWFVGRVYTRRRWRKPAEIAHR